MTSLGENVRRLQMAIASCEKACEGVECRPQFGHLPRGLWLDEQPTKGSKSVIIVGQNPGSPSRKESKLYKAHATNGTEELVTAMNKFVAPNVLEKHAYYQRLRTAAEQLGFDGRIVWTDLVKCSAPDRRKLPIHEYTSTYSRCMNEWLRAELDALPRWPIIAAGRATFDALWPLLHDRVLLGVPHPTGSRGGFARLFPRGKLATGSRSELAQARLRGSAHFYLKA